MIVYWYGKDESDRIAILPSAYWNFHILTEEEIMLSIIQHGILWYNEMEQVICPECRKPVTKLKKRFPKEEGSLPAVLVVCDFCCCEFTISRPSGW